MFRLVQDHDRDPGPVRELERRAAVPQPSTTPEAASRHREHANLRIGRDVVSELVRRVVAVEYVVVHGAPLDRRHLAGGNREVGGLYRVGGPEAGFADLEQPERHAERTGEIRRVREDSLASRCPVEGHGQHSSLRRRV